MNTNITFFLYVDSWAHPSPPQSCLKAQTELGFDQSQSLSKREQLLQYD